MTGTTNAKQHPEIVPIFWEDGGTGGHQWSNNTAGVSMGSAIAQLLNLANSPYTAALSDYGTINGGMISRPRIAATAPIYTTGAAPGQVNTTANYTQGDLPVIIDYMVSIRAVPPPLANTDNVLYVVFVPGGTTGNCGSNGCNWMEHDNSGDPYYTYAVVNTANFGLTLTHEVVEAISGWQNTGFSNCGNNQVADICFCYWDTGTYNFFNMESYWSPQANRCVVPEAWGTVIWNSGGAWNSTGKTARQMYGGAGGLVVTDPSNGDNAYFYNNSSYVSLSATAPEFAAGGTHVAKLGMDTSQAVQWVGTGGGTWNSLPALPAIAGFPNPPPVTSVAVNGIGAVAVTDPTGNVWAWNWNANAWQNLAFTCDQIVADGGNLLCEAVDRYHLWEYPSSQFGTTSQNWNNIGSYSSPVVQLISSSEGVPGYATVFANSSTLYEGGTLLVNGGVSGYEWIGAANNSFATWMRSAYSTQMAYGEYRFRGVWNEQALSGPVGRLASGYYAYGTSCAGLGGLPCVSY